MLSTLPSLRTLTAATMRPPRRREHHHKRKHKDRFILRINKLLVQETQWFCSCNDLCSAKRRDLLHTTMRFRLGCDTNEAFPTSATISVNFSLSKISPSSDANFSPLQIVLGISDACSYTLQRSRRMSFHTVNFSSSSSLLLMFEYFCFLIVARLIPSLIRLRHRLRRLQCC